MTESILARQVTQILRTHQRRRLLRGEAFDEAQLATLNLAQAMRGLVPEGDVVSAVGDATSPNAVSRAARARLPHLR